MKFRTIFFLAIIFVFGFLTSAMADLEKWPDDMRSQLMPAQEISKSLQSEINIRSRKLGKLDLARCDKVKIFDLKLFEEAYPQTIVFIDKNGKFGVTSNSAKSFAPGWTKYNPTCTLIAMPSPDDPKVNRPWFNQTLFHEFVHAVEFKNNDHKDASGNQREANIDWDERNIDWMDWACMILNDYIPPFEAAIKADDFAKAKEAWAVIQSKFDYLPSASANGADHTKNPALPGFLELWFGFKFNLSDIEEFYRSGAAGDKYQAFFAQMQGGLNADFLIQIDAPGIANHQTPQDPDKQKNGQTAPVSIEFEQNKVPLRLSGNIARAEFTAPSSFGGTPEEQKKRGILAKVKIELTFNKDFTAIDKLVFSRECPKWSDKNYKTEEYEQYSFTATGIPVDSNEPDWKSYSLRIDKAGGENSAPDFKFTAGNYLKTRTEQNKKLKDDGSTVEYTNSFRDDGIQLDKAERVVIMITLNDFKI